MRPAAVLCVLGLPVAWLACFSSSSNPDGGASFDASFDTSFGEGSTPDHEVAETGSPDAPPVEAAPPVDAPADAPPDGPPQPVVVTVVGAGGAESGVTVVSEDATGAYLTSWPTVMGKVTEMLPAGSMVTVLLGTPSLPSPITIMGVEPGDLLTIVDPTVPADAVEVSSLPAPLPTGAQSYIAYSGECGQGFTMLPGLPLDLYPGCVGVVPSGSSFAAAIPLFVEAYDTNDDFLGFTFQKNVTLGSANDAGIVTAALTGTWSTTTTQQTVSVANAPSGPTTMAVSEVADGLETVLEGVPGPPDAGMENIYTLHTGFPDSVQVEVDLGQGAALSAVAVATSSAPPTASGALPIDATSLPTFPTISATQVSAGTGGNPVVAWSAGTLNTVTGVFAYATWIASNAEGGSQSGTWTIVSPATAETSLQAPALPPSSAWAPWAGATFPYGSLSAVQGTALPSYAQVRAAASLFPPPPPCLSAPVVPALPIAGTLTFSVYTGAGGCG